MIVAKFGGTSVTGAARIRAVAWILRERLSRRPVAVLSAFAGVTDLLEDIIASASTGDSRRLGSLLSGLELRHDRAIAEMVADAERRRGLRAELARALTDLRRRLHGLSVGSEASCRAADGVLAFGEQLAARIGAAALRDLGLPACWIDPCTVVRTDDRFGSAVADPVRVRQACLERIVPRVERGEIPVLGGYVGATVAGDVTTLGRGGSDTSAAILGLGLAADEIQIWTDVDGVMTADPKLVRDARTLPRLTFAEAADLARYGAHVVHPDAVVLAAGRSLPIRVLNSLRPEGRGTLIAAPTTTPPPARSAPTNGHRVAARPSLGARGNAQIPSNGCLTAEPDPAAGGWMGIALVVPRGREMERVRQALGTGRGPRLSDDCAVLCAVGPGLGETRERERVLAEMSRWCPTVLAADGPPSPVVAALVSRSSLHPALQRLHECLWKEGTQC